MNSIVNPQQDTTERDDNGLTHVNYRGEAQMVDVTDKTASFRKARASAVVLMRPETLRVVLEFGHAKGDVLAVARLAGIQAAKKCSDLIPLCHPLSLTSVSLSFSTELSDDMTDDTITEETRIARLCIESTVKVTGVTGVEMEALTAVSVAALAVYDMCKAVDPHMRITDTQVLGKSGGKYDWGSC
jgi:cyclic pyranopterin phosphate synthase